MKDTGFSVFEAEIEFADDCFEDDNKAVFEDLKQKDVIKFIIGLITLSIIIFIALTLIS